MNLNIRTKLLLFFALTALPMIAIGALSYFNSVGAIEAVVEQRTLKAMQDLEGSTGNITKLFANELGPVLRDVTGAIYELSAALPDLVSRIKSLAHGDLSGLVAGG